MTKLKLGLKCSSHSIICVAAFYDRIIGVVNLSNSACLYVSDIETVFIAVFPSVWSQEASEYSDI